MNMLYHTGHTPDEITVLAGLFAEALEGEDTDRVDRAFALYRQRGKKFPVPAQIIELLPECHAAPRNDLAALPQEPKGTKTPGMGRMAFRALFRDDADARAEMDRLMAKTARACATGGKSIAPHGTEAAQ